MGSLVNIVDRKVAPVFYKRQPVVTLPMVDNLHGRKKETAGRNFRNNRQRFIEDEDFFDVPYEEWNGLFGTTNFVAPKAIEPVNFTGSKNGKGGYKGNMILLTETGYLMIVKTLNDDRAWAVQRALVKAYFRKKQVPPPVTVEEIESFKADIRAGAGVSETARKYGRATSTVKKYSVAERAARAGQMSLFS